MIADLKPYAEYKESGLPWIGRVPRHWDVQKPRKIGSLLKGAGGTKEDAMLAGIPCVRYGELYTTHTFFIRKPKAFIHPDLVSKYTRLQYGDVLFAASGETFEEIGKSAVNLIEDEAVCGGDIIILRPTVPVHAPFLGYVLDCYPSANQKATMGRGTTVKHIYPDELKNLLFPFPPVPEQVAIVRYLEWANGRLERAIRAKRKVIALLNEQKQAIIHRAVTRGLDPAVPLKPSGIPWLGDVPLHWDVLPLKGVCSIQSGITLGKDYAGQALREYPYLRVANVQAGHVKLTVVKTIRVTKAEADRCMLQDGDVLMTEGGDIDKLGRGCVWNAQVSPCLHQNHVFAVRPNQSRLDPRFLSALLGTSYARAYFQSTAKQTTNLAATNKTKLGMFKALLPDVNEQRQILLRLDEELRPVNLAGSRLEREIELLREYRARLVADVVTGKLDVREAAARLPNETPPDPVEYEADPGDEIEDVDEVAAV
jgi:type I restriction enzyme S subunit